MDRIPGESVRVGDVIYIPEESMVIRWLVMGLDPLSAAKIFTGDNDKELVGLPGDVDTTHIIKWGHWPVERTISALGGGITEGSPTEAILRERYRQLPLELSRD